VIGTLTIVYDHHEHDAMEQLTAKLAKFKSNQDFIDLISGAHVVD